MSRKRKGPDEVELNLAAMLDMAFQLLAFFVMTFQPAPVEAQVSMRLPKPQAVAGAVGARKAGEEDKKDEPVKGYDTLIINLARTDDDPGKLGHIYLVYGSEKDKKTQEVPLATGEKDELRVFKETLKAWLNDPGMPFDQVIIAVDSNLRYEYLMQVIEVCSKQTIGGDPKNKLSKLSVVDQNNWVEPGAAKK